MKKLKVILFIGLLLPTLSMACGSLEYWAKKYIDGSEDKETMVKRMAICLKHYPSQVKDNNLILYKVFSDAVKNKKILKDDDTLFYLEDIFYKSNCLVEADELKNYEVIKEKFGDGCEVQK